MGSLNKLEGRIIPLTKLSGPEQMAIDNMLLKKAIEGKTFNAFFRLYLWRGNCLSIGKNQKNISKEWIDISKKNKLKIIRRPTGGSAVLHSGGITYSLIMKDETRNKEQAYFNHCQWLIEAFKELGIKLNFGNDSQNLLEVNCFASASKADLIDNNGVKRIGSAQLWRKQYLLQHGEIILNPEKELWEEVFNLSPPNKTSITSSLKDIELLLLKSFYSSYPDFSWVTKELSHEELGEINREKNKYLINDN